MNREYFTVEQIAELLAIHPKTIQRYIREGRLRASKIGKSWRVTGHDLSLFVEHNPEAASATEPPAMQVTASSVIDITVPGKNEAIRIMNTLTAALNAKPPEYGQSSLQSQYLESEKRVRVTLWGGVRFLAVMLETIASLTENDERL
jgi:excisionase family DNA binding protein